MVTLDRNNWQALAYQLTHQLSSNYQKVINCWHIKPIKHTCSADAIFPAAPKQIYIPYQFRSF